MCEFSLLGDNWGIYNTVLMTSTHYWYVFKRLICTEKNLLYCVSLAALHESNAQDDKRLLYSPWKGHCMDVQDKHTYECPYERSIGTRCHDDHGPHSARCGHSLVSFSGTGTCRPKCQILNTAEHRVPSVQPSLICELPRDSMVLIDLPIWEGRSIGRETKSRNKMCFCCRNG